MSSQVVREEIRRGEALIVGQEETWLLCQEQERSKAEDQRRAKESWRLELEGEGRVGGASEGAGEEEMLAEFSEVDLTRIARGELELEGLPYWHD